MRSNIIKYFIIVTIISVIASQTVRSAQDSSASSLVSFQTSVPIQFNHVNLPLNDTQAKAIQWGLVKLIDGEELEGQVLYDQFQQTTLVIYTTNDQEVVYEYIPISNITSIELSQKEPAPAPEIEHPMNAEIHLLDGNMFAGVWDSEVSTGYIKIKPKGFQPLMIPVSIISRIILRGNSRIESTTVQDSNEQEKTINSSSIKPSRRDIDESTSTIVTNSPVSVLPFMNITVKNGDQHTGLYTYDPVKNLAVLISMTDDGKRKYDFISGNYIQNIHPISLQDNSQDVYSDRPIQEPIAVQVNDIFGKQINGTLIKLDQENQIHVLQDNEKQPFVIPMQNILIVTMIEQAETFQSVSASNTKEKKDETKPENELNTQDTVYQTIAIGPLPKTSPLIPPLKSKVRIKTNLDQLYIGELVVVEEEWLGIMVSQLGQLTLSPPQYSMINRKFLTLVETREQINSSL